MIPWFDTADHEEQATLQQWLALAAPGARLSKSRVRLAGVVSTNSEPPCMSANPRIEPQATT